MYREMIGQRKVVLGFEAILWKEKYMERNKWNVLFADPPGMVFRLRICPV